MKLIIHDLSKEDFNNISENLNEEDIIICKGKSGSGFLIFIVWFYCILQSTGLPYDRERSVTQTHQLT